MNISMLAEVCACLSDRLHAVTLYDLLLPYATHNAVIGGDAVGCHGAVARLLGLLATTLQRWEPAVQHFEAALSMHQRMGARPFVARTQYAYAAMLVARNAPGDAAQAQALLTLAHTTAQDLQMQGLMPSLLEMQSRVPPVSTPDDVPDVVHTRASAPRGTGETTPEPGLASPARRKHLSQRGGLLDSGLPGENLSPQRHPRAARHRGPLARARPGTARPRHPDRPGRGPALYQAAGEWR